MSNPLLLSMVASCLLSAWPGPDLAAAAAAARKPNIVLIVADDLGYGELGVQGYSHDIPTPHIDSLARNGIRFTQGYVSAPLCSPSRAGLLTGRYQQRFGHEFNPTPEAKSYFGLPEQQRTLPEQLKALGYATGMIGKWHLGTQPEFGPLRRGFDEFYGTLTGMRPYFGKAAHDPVLRGAHPVDESEYLTDALGREAASFIQRHRTQPFFLYLPFTAVHTPMQAPETYMRRFESIKNNKRRTFAAMTSAMDDAVGRVLDQLKRHNLSANTLLFFISDNGGSTPATTSSNGPLRGHKGQLFEGGIRVPFMLQWEGHLAKGEVNKAPVIALDIFPTAVAAAGGTTPADWKLDGVNLLPFLGNEAKSLPHRTLAWRKGKQHAVREGDWKLLMLPRLGAPALFNLAEDIGERHDLAGKMTDKVKQLSARYDEWNAQMVRPRWADKTERRRLKHSRRANREEPTDNSED